MIRRGTYARMEMAPEGSSGRVLLVPDMQRPRRRITGGALRRSCRAGLLDQSESGTLIVNGRMRDILPDTGLQPFPLVLRELHESNGELASRHPDNMR